MEIFFCDSLQQFPADTQRLVDSRYRQVANKLAMFFQKIRQTPVISFFTDKISNIKGEEIAALEKKIHIAEPDWKMNAAMKIDGRSVEVKKAYSSRTPGRLQMGKGHNTFTGFYVDVSDLQPDREYEVEVTLPNGLKPGQFQGLFFENVETEYTDRLVN